jgi:hypothetical protein
MNRKHHRKDIMQQLATVLEIAIEQCCELSVIDRTSLTTLQATCILEFQPMAAGYFKENGIERAYWLGSDYYYVWLLGVFIVIDARRPRAWHASTEDENWYLTVPDERERQRYREERRARHEPSTN